MTHSQINHAKAWGFNMEKGQLKIGDFSNGD